MNLESIIQSEVSQKEKNKYCIRMHTYRIQKDGTDEPMLSSSRDLDIEKRRMDMAGGGGGRRGWDVWKE